MIDLKQFKAEVKENFQENILKFWKEKMIDPAGGFYGQMNADNTIEADAPKGAILNARILWTYAAAYKATQNKEYLEMADRAYEYFVKYFIDKEYGGIYWSVNADGTPCDTKKQFYAHGFAIYGLSEYYGATEKQEALDYAIEVFNVMEKYSYDQKSGGYIEATQRDWSPILKMRLSSKDANEPFSMNTHLHILEPYTNLYRVWKSDHLKDVLSDVINIFCEKIYDKETHHLGLFFNLKWQCTDHAFSYGHDIEASWLLLEAAIELGDESILNRVKPISYNIAMAALDGLQPDGSLIYEWDHLRGHDMERHWWVQAEAVVGLLWLHEHHGYEKGYEQAVKCWEYIKENLIDQENGEWWWSRMPDGTINTKKDKAGFWKCCYHNGRMCLNIMHR